MTDLEKLIQRFNKHSEKNYIQSTDASFIIKNKCTDEYIKIISREDKSDQDIEKDILNFFLPEEKRKQSMTKEEYNHIIKYSYIPDDVKEFQRALNSANGYGISDNLYLHLIREHRIARTCDDYTTMSIIEYRFSDLNFHYEAGQLFNGKYDELLESKSQRNDDQELEKD